MEQAVGLIGYLHTSFFEGFFSSCRFNVSFTDHGVRFLSSRESEFMALKRVTRATTTKIVSVRRRLVLTTTNKPEMYQIDRGSILFDFQL